jgi:hypothetical protein
MEAWRGKHRRLKDPELSGTRSRDDAFLRNDTRNST